VGVLLVLVGCKSAPPIHVTSSSPATIPTGWAVGQSDDRTVTVGIPQGWRQGVDKLTDGLGDLSGLGGGMGSNTPDASQMGSDIANMDAQLRKDSDENEKKALADLEKKGIIVNVINGSKQIPGEARTKFYVRRFKKDSNVTWDDAMATEKENFAFAPKPTEVKLPIGKALRYSADEEMRDGGVVHRISYVVVDGHNAYSLRFVTEESGDVIKSIADQVANTWRIQVK